ncbi:uncharacterized protein [Eurosta solidaginis]|uniref:uncharacterized protein n=1 Tax=Eurosta solidaginis TaxID=178769 RepID=UPI0035308386
MPRPTRGNIGRRTPHANAAALQRRSQAPDERTQANASQRERNARNRSVVPEIMRAAFNYNIQIDYRMYGYIGIMDAICPYCEAAKFPGETPGMCCDNGKFQSRDVILHRTNEQLQRASEFHRSYDALHYPILHWKGDDGYHINEPMIDPGTDMYLTIANKALVQLDMIAPIRDMHDLFDRELQREQEFNSNDLRLFVQSNITKMSIQQKLVYDTITQAITNNAGGLYFFDAPGGTGKTFVILLILWTIRSEEKTALALASSGIAATLLEGGRTAHFALKLLLNVQEYSSNLWEVDCQKNGPKFFKENFRMTRSSFEKLCIRLQKMKKKDTNYRNAIPLEKRVAIALYALGSSSEYRSIASLFGVGKATVCKILIEFCNEVWACMAREYFKSFPLTRTGIEQGVADFNAMGYPQCIGAIGKQINNNTENSLNHNSLSNTDGCHIEIHPKKEEAADYYNYKGWYSVVLLALLDAKYRFMYIHCGSPGRCNDSSIFERSSLKRELQECALLDEMSWYHGRTKIPVHIISDSAFRLSQYVMKPYPYNIENSAAQKLFNYRLSKCRRVVENAFGHYKARFRRIGKGIDNHIKNENVVISAACAFHNFLIDEKDPVLENWLVDMQRYARRSPQGHNNLNYRSEGEVIRNGLMEYFDCK